MTRTINKVSLLTKAISIGATGILSGVLMLSNTAIAQDSDELNNLVLQPMLLSRAENSRVSMGGLPENQKQNIIDSISGYKFTVENSKSEEEVLDRLGVLAVSYQQIGRHEDAIAALEQAISLVVKKDGKDTLAQLTFQEQLIPSYIATNEISKVDDTEDLIFSLSEEAYAPGSSEMYGAVANYADWNMSAYYRENFGVNGQSLRSQRTVVNKVTRSVNISGPGGDQASVEANANSDRGVSSGSDMMSAIFNGSVKDVSNQDVNASRLRKVDGLYEDFQEAFYASDNPQLNVAIDIAQRIARLAFATKQEMDFERDNYTFVPNYDGSREQAIRNDPKRLDESYESGRDALEFVITTLRSVQGIKNEVISQALLDLADWSLAYGKVQTAKDYYAEATQVLKEAGFTQGNIDTAFKTELPLQIPLFATHLYSRNSVGVDPSADLSLQGYVDVSFSVDTQGNASEVQILSASSEDSSTVERLIKTQMKSMKFRPVLSGGELASSGQVNTRYYYAY